LLINATEDSPGSVVSRAFLSLTPFFRAGLQDASSSYPKNRFNGLSATTMRSLFPETVETVENSEV